MASSLAEALEEADMMKLVEGIGSEKKMMQEGIWLCTWRWPFTKILSGMHLTKLPNRNALENRNVPDWDYRCLVKDLAFLSKGKIMQTSSLTDTCMTMTLHELVASGSPSSLTGWQGQVQSLATHAANYWQNAPHHEGQAFLWASCLDGSWGFCWGGGCWDFCSMGEWLRRWEVFEWWRYSSALPDPRCINPLLTSS